MKPKAPKHLAADGRALWLELQRAYQIVDSGGLALLTTACECLDRMRNAQKLIAERGELIADRYGGLRANPAVIIEKDARSGLLAAIKMLNLDVEPIKAIGRPGGPGVNRADR
jgi:P27 family predicted phage terminase small subunit